MNDCCKENRVLVSTRVTEDSVVVSVLRCSVCGRNHYEMDVPEIVVVSRFERQGIEYAAGQGSDR
ncbi:MAG: hypothetical protein QXG97_00140 [Nitrososphaerota archaeon]